MGKILIGGASGLVGRALATALCERVGVNKRTSLVFLGETGSVAGLPPAPTAPWPTSDRVAFSEALRDAEAIVFAEPLPLPPPCDPTPEQPFEKVLEERTQQLAACADVLRTRRGKPLTVIVLSSLWIFGNRDGVVTESTAIGSESWVKHYAAFEAAVRALPYGVARIVVLRLAPTPEDLARAVLPRSREGSVPWIAPEDVLNLLLHCLERASLEGTVNAVSPEPLPIASVIETFEKRGVPTPKTGLRDENWPHLDAKPQKATASGFRFEKAAAADAFALLSEVSHGSEELDRSRWLPQSPSAVWDRLVFGEHRYRATLASFPLQWDVRRTAADDRSGFDEEFLRGALVSFRRTVRLRPLSGGTQIEDRTEYRLRGGNLFGRWLGESIRERITRLIDATWELSQASLPPEELTQ